MTHPGQVFPAEQIYENVWQETADYTVENTVMVHIRHIREKVEIDAKKPRYVKVVWGIGYKMEKYGIKLHSIYEDLEKVVLHEGKIKIPLCKQVYGFNGELTESEEIEF